MLSGYPRRWRWGKRLSETVYRVSSALIHARVLSVKRLEQAVRMSKPKVLAQFLIGEALTHMPYRFQQDALRWSIGLPILGGAESEWALDNWGFTYLMHTGKCRKMRPYVREFLAPRANLLLARR